MYIFYAVCLLFLPYISRSIQVFRKKTESSLKDFVYIISCFTLIFAPFLALNVFPYQVCLILSWIIFAAVIVVLVTRLIVSTFKFIKVNSLRVYKETLKYIFISSIFPSLFFLIFFLSILFVSIKFNDQLAYTNISANYRLNIFSFYGGEHSLGYWYQITPGYFVNSAMGFSRIIAMYDFVWTIIPFFLVVYGTNDILLQYFKRNLEIKYYLSCFILLLGLYILSYAFIWAYGSGNTLFQASIIFLLIYFLKIKEGLKFIWLTTLFLMFFSPTGILLSVGLIIVSFMYVIIFRNIKSLFYWIAYLLFIMGPIVSITIDTTTFIYLILSISSFSYLFLFFIFSSHYDFSFFSWNFLESYKKYNFLHQTNDNFFGWYFKKLNFDYWTICLMLFCTVLIFVLYLTILKSNFIFNGLTIVAFIINLFLLVALAYTLVRKNEFNQTLFLLYFLTVSCFVVSLIIFFSFKGNESTWRISYLCIGFETPFNYLSILGITGYVYVIDKIHFNKKTNKKNHNLTTKWYKQILSVNKVSFAATWVTVFTASIIYDALSMATYPINLNDDILQAKLYFNAQELLELSALKKQSVNQNIISDSPIFTALYGAKNVDDDLLQNAHNQSDLNNYFKNYFGNEGSIYPWKLSMFDFDKSILEYALNYYNVTNESLVKQLDNLFMNTDNQQIKNFMSNTFYGNDYIQNFLNIVNTANKYDKAKISYLIFNSSSSYFNEYEKRLFPELEKNGYEVILKSNNTQQNLNHLKIEDTSSYLYVLEYK